MERYKNPKHLNTEIKLKWFVYMPDLIIIVASFGLGWFVTQALGLVILLQVVTMVLFVSFGLFLCVRTSSRDRMITKLLHVARMDRRTYRSIEL